MILLSRLLPPRRISLSALAVLALGSSGGALVAQGVNSHDSKAPVDYAADRIEVQDKAKRVLLSGHVDITQKDLRLRAARVLVSYTGEGSGGDSGINIQRIDATNDVEVIRGEEHVWGDVATYDFGRRIITVVGHVRLKNARGDGTGERLLIDLDRHTSNFVGSSSGTPGSGGNGGGRVTGRFTVSKKD